MVISLQNGQRSANPRKIRRIVRGMFSPATLVLAFLFAGCGVNVPVVGVNSGTSTSPGPLPPPPTDSNWKMTFDEEFNEAALDTTNWTPDNSKTCGDENCFSTRSPANVTVSNGSLHLLATQGSTVPGYTWTTGAVFAKKFSQQYGYWEARIKYAGASGFNNAFWLNSETSAGETPYEIDINEGHYYKQINMDYHEFPGGHDDKQEYAVDANVNLTSDYHIYGLSWNADTITWYFDGTEIWTLPNRGTSSNAQIVLSGTVLAWAGHATPGLNGMSMDVDWVHVFTATTKNPTTPPMD